MWRGGNPWARRALAQIAALVDDVGAVADAQRLLHVVVGDQHGDAVVGKPPHLHLQLLDGVRVDRSERLVEQHELGARHEGARDLQAPALAARAGARLILGLVQQAELLEELAGARLALLAAERLRLEDGQQILLAAQALEDAWLLRQIAHARKRVAVHGLVRDVPAIEMHRATLRGDHADGHAKAGGLASAVAPEQAHDLARVHLERHPVDDTSTGVGLDEVLRFEKWHTRSVARACAISGSGG
jgi:hypothetical protein